MTIKITTPNGGSDSLDFGCAQTAIVATVTGTEVSSGEGKLELKTTTGGTSATRLTIDPNGRVQIDGEMTDDFLVIKTTEAGTGSAPDVVLYRSSSSPADSDSLGKVVFRGRNDNSQDVEYAQVIAQAIDVSDGTEDGKLYLQTIQAGSHVNNLILSAEGNHFTGNVLVGQSSTTTPGQGNTTTGFSILPDGRFFSSMGGTFGQINRNSDGAVLSFSQSGTTVGSISVNGTNTAYNTSSDYRLKENISYTWDATTRLKQLKPARFNFIADPDNTVDGFMAHEAQEVVPESVTGVKDEVDDDDNPVMQGIDQSKLVPLLVKTIQELEARIAKLEEDK